MLALKILSSECGLSILAMLLAVALFDANCTAALTTAVLFRVAHCFRASIAGNPTVTVLADEPPLWRGEAFAVLRSIKGVRPPGERRTVIRVAELVILPGVNEFVPDGGTELFPPVVFVSRPGQRNRDCLCCRVVLGDPCLSLRSV